MVLLIYLVYWQPSLIPMRKGLHLPLELCLVRKTFSVVFKYKIYISFLTLPI